MRADSVDKTDIGTTSNRLLDGAARAIESAPPQHSPKVCEPVAELSIADVTRLTDQSPK